MSQSKIYLIVAGILIMIGCGPGASFNQPQPPDANSLSQFPKSIQYSYASKDGSSILTITNTGITRTYDYTCKAAISQLDSTFKLVGDTLYDLTDKKKQKITRHNDSITIPVHSEDTLFHISEKNMLKKMKGYYFLNFQNADNLWSVKMLEIAHGILIIHTVGDKTDITMLRELTGQNDTTSFVFNPTKKEFKKFIKSSDLSNNEIFLRIR